MLRSVLSIISKAAGMSTDISTMVEIEGLAFADEKCDLVLLSYICLW
jgi:hypothetical protein